MGCFTFRSIATVMVFVILLLVTTPILVLRKFLSDIFLAFCFYPPWRIRHFVLFFICCPAKSQWLMANCFSILLNLSSLILFLTWQFHGVGRGLSSGSPAEKSNEQIEVSSTLTHLPGSELSGLIHSAL